MLEAPLEVGGLEEFILTGGLRGKLLVYFSGVLVVQSHCDLKELCIQTLKSLENGSYLILFSDALENLEEIERGLDVGDFFISLKAL